MKLNHPATDGAAMALRGRLIRLLPSLIDSPAKDGRDGHRARQGRAGGVLLDEECVCFVLLSVLCECCWFMKSTPEVY